MPSLNLVLNIPKNKIDNIKSYLTPYKKNSKDNEYLVISARNNSINYNLFTSGKLVLQSTDKNKLNLEKEKLTQMVYSNSNLILGFDETGRSEVEGPFVITGILGSDKDFIDLRDSKKTSNINDAKRKVDKNKLLSATLVLNPKIIDALRLKGITLNDMEEKFIVKIKEYIESLELEFSCKVDGKSLKTKVPCGLDYVPSGDDIIPTISASSIYSKYIRDNSKNKDKKETWNIKN